MLNLLINEYIPALMHIGIRVRDLYWEKQTPGTGSMARSVLQQCHVLLMSLEARDKVEYVRGLSLALMFWSNDMHETLPGACYVEECLEASLSRLSHAAGTDLRATSVAQFSDIYAALGPPRVDRKVLHKPGINRQFIGIVLSRCRRLMDIINRGCLPRAYIQAGNKFATINAVWSCVPLRTPTRLLVSELQKDDFKRALAQSLLRLLSTKGPDATLNTTAIVSWAPRLTSTDILHRQEDLKVTVDNLRIMIRPTIQSMLFSEMCQY